MPALVLALGGAAPTGGQLPRGAPGGESALCVEAARAAARRHGIPERVMQAITLVETRRRIGGVTRPWPWTLNVEGEGHWFASRGDALGHAMREMARGRRSIDLGCFQLNWRWHGENFATPDDMLDPARSADYAARFLAGLRAETGDWMRAAGHYHSRTPQHAARYRGLIGRALARLEAGSGPGSGSGAGHASEAPAPADRPVVLARAAPAPPVRPASAPEGGEDARAPLIQLGAARGGGAVRGARTPGGVALNLFARAEPFGFARRRSGWGSLR